MRLSTHRREREPAQEEAGMQRVDDGSGTGSQQLEALSIFRNGSLSFPQQYLRV